MPYLPGVMFPSEADPIYQVGDGRLWVKAERDEAFGYLGCFGVGGFSWAQPSVEPLWCPDPTRPRKFVRVDTVVGTPSLPEVPITGRSTRLQWIYERVRRGCPLMLDVRYTTCGDVSDPLSWEWIRRFCRARITNYSSGDQAMMNENAEIIETADLTADDMYILRRLLAEEAVNPVAAAITAVASCDRPNCGECGLVPSAGCRRWVLGTEAVAGTPYILVTTDGGQNFTARAVTPWTGGEEVSGIVCLDNRVVVISQDRGALCYSDDWGVTWTEVLIGFQAGGDGRDIFALDSRHVWIAGEAGTIYFTDDVTLGVSVQEDGLLTTSNLNKIRFVNALDGYCVGDNNTFLYTSDGGGSWAAGVGPLAGQDLTALAACHDPTQSMVIVGTGNGQVWQSYDGGDTWTQRVLPGVGTYNIPDITLCGCGCQEMFLLREVGTYLAPTDGELWRTIDGGLSWQEIALPTNLGVEAMACCHPNGAVLGGTIQAGGEGFIALVGDLT